MPPRTPRTIAENTLRQKPKGEPSYCGICGQPMKGCDCKQYKDRGADATSAGSASADDKMDVPSEGKAPPFGKKEE